jgi:oxygen-independent coproporphyrinogen-3 oxidase
MLQISNNKLSQLPPLGLYIHIPWCVKKCPYCDFNSHNLTNELPEAKYVESLISDLEQSLPLIWGRSIRTIFIGGGTPSLFSPDAINHILQSVRSLTRLSPLAEITIEANPGTVDNEHISGYHKAGVNRISFGIQSFNDKHLKSLGRIHDSGAAVNAINLARKYFSQINLDLIYGLPSQTLSELEDDINKAVSFDTTHLSLYNLTVEPNTQFYAKPPEHLPDNDLCYQMQDLIVNNLSQHGYSRYEVSAYAKDANFCQHNLNYWQFGDYLGVGAGAHGKISFHDKIIRQVRHKHPKTYMDNVGLGQHIIEDKTLISSELPFEFMLNALRLNSGFAASLFVERTGLGLNKILNQLESAQQKGFLKFRDGKIIPTNLGQDFLNDLLLLFLD